MRLSLPAALLFTLTLSAQDSSTAEDWRSWLNRGVEAFKSARYQEAVEDFQKSVYLRPNEVAPHLYLATTWMTQYIPGAVSAENLDLQHKAEAEFSLVLQLDPQDLTALQSLASLFYQEAQGMKNSDEKLRKLDEAASWYQRVLTVDPRDKAAYYSLGVIDWVKWYAGWIGARSRLGMRPEQPGPLTDAAVRQDLLAHYSPIIADGIANLEKALEIDPQYDDAMAYMNLFIRERADLRDTQEEYRRDVETADQWVHKALETKRMKTRSFSPSQLLYPREAPVQGTALAGGIIGGIIGSVPTAAPPAPPAPSAARYQTPQQIRVGGNVMQANLIRRVEPLYPDLARQARIQGVVRFTATIGKDGRILNLMMISGHPLLIESARQAVSQWEYKPVLLNGEPVEVLTTIDVSFTLSQ